MKKSKFYAGFIALSFLLCFFLLLSACDEDEEITSGHPRISTNPRSVDFGEVTKGDEIELSLIISNQGGATLEITSKRLEFAGNFSAELDKIPATLEPQQSVTIKIKFNAPETLRKYGTTLFIESNDPANPEYAVSIDALVVLQAIPKIRVICIPPGIESEENGTDNCILLNFGNVKQTGQVEAKISVSNMGSGTLVITQVDLNSQGSNNPFSFKEQVQVPFSLRRYEKNVISLLYTPSTATSDTGTVVFKTNDQQHKQWTINIWAGNPAGKIQICVFVQDGNKECNNLSITFPETALNKSASARLLVGNIGVGDLLVNSIKTNTTGGGDQVFEVNSPQAAPFTLKSQSEVELSANYKPVKAGQDKGTLTVESDDPDNPKMEIKLAGGQFPDIDIAPSVLAFGKIDIGKSAELAITISNSGRADLIIDKVQLQQNSSDEFSIPALESSLPYTIAPQNSKDFMVRYESKYATANKMATLEISSNDPDLSENPYLINVSAQSEVNLPPVANITVPNDVIYGYDLQTPTDIMLDGSKSSDREGSPLTYKWEMIKKPLGSKSDLASTDKVSTTFKADQWGSYTIGLIVFDNYKQASGQATKSLSINQ